ASCRNSQFRSFNRTRRRAAKSDAAGVAALALRGARPVRGAASDSSFFSGFGSLRGLPVYSSTEIGKKPIPRSCATAALRLSASSVPVLTASAPRFTLYSKVAIGELLVHDVGVGSNAQDFFDRRLSGLHARPP